MKKKAMIMAVASLGSMALIGTGFAGWVISANATTNPGGVIMAFDVADHRLVVEDGTWANTSEKEESIVYGKTGTVAAGNWFTFDNNVADQKLTDTYTFGVKSNDTSDNGTFSLKKQTAWFGVTDADGHAGAWDNAVKLGLVAKEPTVSFGADSYTLTGTAAVEATVTVTFAWGDHFTVGTEVKNPFDFYNSKTASEKASDTTPDGYTLLGDTFTWADDAKYYMGKLAEIAGASFKLNLSVERAAA